MNKTLFYTNPTFIQPTRLKFTSPPDLSGGLLRSKYSFEKVYAISTSRNPTLVSAIRKLFLWWRSLIHWLHATLPQNKYCYGETDLLVYLLHSLLFLPAQQHWYKGLAQAGQPPAPLPVVLP